jgi:hypothetical protein
MYFWRAILASLLSLVCTLTISAFVTLQTLQATVLDRQQVKTWLVNGGVYPNLLNTVLANNAQLQQLATSATAPDTVKTALNQTFTPAYVQQATEKSIDGAYDWLEGKQSTISFSVNTTTQKAAFTENLAALLEPQLAAFPRCTSTAQFNSQNPTCLPPGMTAQQAATALATDAGNSSLFTQPLTDQNISQTLGSTNQASAPLTAASATGQLPQLVKNLQLWLILLPIIAIASGGLMVWLSQHRLKAAKHLAGRLAFGMALTCVLGLIVATIGKTFQLSNYVSGTNNAVITGVIEPVIHQAAPAIGNRLALVSGILGVITGILWVALLVFKKRTDKAGLLAPPAGGSSEPTAPKEPKADQPSPNTS